MELIVFSNRTSIPRDSIAMGWLIAFLLTSFVAIWELWTGNHLSIAKEHLSREGSNIENSIGSYASVTFYNINTYAIYIVEAIPFIFYSIASRTSMKRKIIALYCAILAMILLLITGSRGASISLALMFLVFLFFMIKGGKMSKINFKWVLGLLCIIIYILYTYGDVLLSIIIYKSETRGMLEDDYRMIIYAKSWELITNSLGVGTGAGSMVPAMEAQGNYLGIYYVHNLFLEFLMQYGVLLFAGFIYYLYKLFVQARRRQIPSKIVLYSALIGLPFYSVVNSEYTHLRFVWCYFAVLFVYASSNYDEHYDCLIQEA